MILWSTQERTVNAAPGADPAPPVVYGPHPNPDPNPVPALPALLAAYSDSDEDVEEDAGQQPPAQHATHRQPQSDRELAVWQGPKEAAAKKTNAASSSDDGVAEAGHSLPVLSRLDSGAPVDTPPEDVVAIITKLLPFLKVRPQAPLCFQRPLTAPSMFGAHHHQKNTDMSPFGGECLSCRQAMMCRQARVCCARSCNMAAPAKAS